MRRKLLGIISVGFDATGQLLIIYCVFVKCLGKHCNKTSSATALIDFKKAYDSVRTEVLYNTVIEFGIPMKLVRLVKMFLIGTYSRVRVGKNLSDMFPVGNCLKQGDAPSSLLFKFSVTYSIGRILVNNNGLKLNGTYQFLVCADDVSIFGGSVHTINKNAESFVVASK